MIRSSVRVPVLSVHKTVNAPRSSIELSRFTITRFRAIAMAPRVRFAAMIIGNISGVSPTATERAKRKAVPQSPFVSPLSKRTTGIISNIDRMSSQLMLLIPRSKLVAERWAMVFRVNEPNKVASPVAKTTAVAVPLITLVPMRPRFDNSVRSPRFGVRVRPLGCSCNPSNFSTGNASPLKTD